MRKIAVILFVLFSQASLSVFADEDREQDQALKLRQQGVILPLETILQAAQKVHPGRVVEVELEHEHKSYIYEIEIVDNSGQVWKMIIDAKDANVISAKRED